MTSIELRSNENRAPRVNQRWRVSTIVTVSIALMGALITIAILHAQHPKPQVAPTISYSAITSVSIAASALILKRQQIAGNRPGTLSALPV